MTASSTELERPFELPAMPFHCVLPQSAVPAGDGWLSSAEKRIQADLHLEKRRLDWRLGRFTAKRLLIDSKLVAALDPSRLSIEAAEDGAPEILLDRRLLGITLSISHAAGHGAAAANPGRLGLGCDLERVEPRSAAFVDTFFTEHEARQVAAAGRHAALVANLIWSAKESWLKACRTGLRRDTRGVEVSLDPSAPERGGWRAFELRDRELDRRGLGRWRRVADDVILTLAQGAP